MTSAHIPAVASGYPVRDGNLVRPLIGGTAAFDDAWTTIGSCNLHANSLGGATEMNASIWDAAIARDLRCALFQRHLGLDPAALDDVEALRLYRRIADKNGGTDWQGEAFTLEPRRYAVA